MKASLRAALLTAAWLGVVALTVAASATSAAAQVIQPGEAGAEDFVDFFLGAGVGGRPPHSLPGSSASMWRAIP